MEGHCWSRCVDCCPSEWPSRSIKAMLGRTSNTPAHTLPYHLQNFTITHKLWTLKGSPLSCYINIHCPLLASLMYPGYISFYRTCTVALQSPRVCQGVWNCVADKTSHEKSLIWVLEAEKPTRSFWKLTGEVVPPQKWSRFSARSPTSLWLGKDLKCSENWN